MFVEFGHHITYLTDKLQTNFLTNAYYIIYVNYILKSMFRRGSWLKKYFIPEQ